LYNPTNKQFISYDDTVSLGVKADYAINTGLAGLFVWSVDEDNGELLGSIAKVVSGNPSRTTITTGTATATATSTTTKTATGTVTTTATPTSTGSCAGVSAWSSSGTYVAGDQVTYNNALFKAAYWSHGETPSATASYGAWNFVKNC
jgi:chitinase